MAQMASVALARRRQEHERAWSIRRRPNHLVVMGITDAWLHSNVPASIGSGIDKVLSPSMLPELSALSDIAPPKLALVVTGLERDFARFNPRGANGTKYASAQRAAWDPRLIRGMLEAVLESRPHLFSLLRNDSAFRPASDAITVTAAMPCGFVNGLGFANYNGWNPGWIVGAPWIREEKESPVVVPHHCADALITALTGRTTEFQLTTQDIVLQSTPRSTGTPALRPGIGRIVAVLAALSRPFGEPVHRRNREMRPYAGSCSISRLIQLVTLTILNAICIALDV